MVEKYVTIRNKLDKKIFIPYGKTVTFKSRGSPTYNSRGEVEAETYTTTSIPIVPYNIIDANQSYEAFGNLEAGDLDAAVPYNVSVAIDDVITMEGTDYRIKAIEKNYLPENVVTIIRITKVL
jgi:SPP1 family predicted phage head-tail adaptor